MWCIVNYLLEIINYRNYYLVVINVLLSIICNFIVSFSLNRSDIFTFYRSGRT